MCGLQFYYYFRSIVGKTFRKKTHNDLYCRTKCLFLTIKPERSRMLVFYVLYNNIYVHRRCRLHIIKPIDVYPPDAYNHY